MVVDDDGIVPPGEGNGNEEPQKTAGAKKSFVRVPRGSKKKEAKRVVIEPEVLEREREADDSDDDDEGSDDSHDIIDVGDFEGFVESSRAEMAMDHDSGDLVPVRPMLPLDEEEAEDRIPDERGLVVSTGLQRYLAELRKYPLMTPEEERQVAFLSYEQGDIEARKRLVNANLRLVVKIAMEYRRAYSQILDLIQEGNAGLVQAVQRFNPYRGVKLSTYSAWWIRAYILKFLMDNKSLVRMGTTDAQRKLFFRLRSEAEKMYAQTQRFDAHLLAENIGVKEQDVVEMQQRLSKSDMSLDAPIGDEGDARHVDTLVSSGDYPEGALEKEEISRILRQEAMAVEKELNERDLFIFRHRIMSEDPITLHDVGVKFGITRERARQLEARILKKMRERLEGLGITGS